MRRATVLAVAAATAAAIAMAQPPPSKAVTLDLGGGVTMEFVRIPAGEFLMGSPDDDPHARPHEKPRHRVRISKDFYLGKTPVTRGQFRRFIEDKQSVENRLILTEAERYPEGGGGYDAAAGKFEGQKP